MPLTLKVWLPLEIVGLIGGALLSPRPVEWIVWVFTVAVMTALAYGLSRRLKIAYVLALLVDGGAVVSNAIFWNSPEWPHPWWGVLSGLVGLGLLLAPASRRWFASTVGESTI